MNNVRQIYGAAAEGSTDPSDSNFAQLVNPEIEELIPQIDTETDLQTRIDLTNQADALIWDQVHTLPIYRRQSFTAVPANLANFGALDVPAVEPPGRGHRLHRLADRASPRKRRRGWGPRGPTLSASRAPRQKPVRIEGGATSSGHGTDPAGRRLAEELRWPHGDGRAGRVPLVPEGRHQLLDELAAREAVRPEFGQENVFFDVDSVAIGSNVRTTIQRVHPPLGHAARRHRAVVVPGAVAHRQRLRAARTPRGVRELGPRRADTRRVRLDAGPGGAPSRAGRALAVSTAPAFVPPRTSTATSGSSSRACG